MKVKRSERLLDEVKQIIIEMEDTDPIHDGIGYKIIFKDGSNQIGVAPFLLDIVDMLLQIAETGYVRVTHVEEEK